MSFKASGSKTRPERVKPVRTPSPARFDSDSDSDSDAASFASAVEDHVTPPSVSGPSNEAVSNGGVAKEADSSGKHESGDKNKKHKDDKKERAEVVRFSPSEEAKLVSSSNELKSQANGQFAHKDYSSALSTYDRALAELPNYLDYELAVLQSNIAACHVQLKEWKEAIEAADSGLEGLEKELPMPKPPKSKSEGETETGSGAKDKTQKSKVGKEGGRLNKSGREVTKEGDGDGDEDKIIELPSSDDEATTLERLRQLNLSDQRKADIRRIRTKLLLRRARAHVSLVQTASASAASSATASASASKAVFGDTGTMDDSASADNDADGGETNGTDAAVKKAAGNEKGKGKAMADFGTWSHLSSALSDYQTLSAPEYFRSLPPSDQKTVIDALRTLPSQTEAAKKKEVDEMLGKLKDLGNGILKPFGLSTDMFKMVQDPSSGGWSMNFDGASKGKAK